MIVIIMLDQLPLDILSIIVDYLDNTTLWGVSQNITNMLTNYHAPVLYLYNDTGSRRHYITWAIKIKFMRADKIMCDDEEFYQMMKHTSPNLNIHYHERCIHKCQTVTNGDHMIVLCSDVELNTYINGVMKIYTLDDKDEINIEINQYSIDTEFRIINKSTREYPAKRSPRSMCICFYRDRDFLGAVILDANKSLQFKCSDYIVDLPKMYPEQNNIFNNIDDQRVEEFMLSEGCIDDSEIYISYLINGAECAYIKKTLVIQNIRDKFINYIDNMQTRLGEIRKVLTQSGENL